MHVFYMEKLRGGKKTYVERAIFHYWTITMITIFSSSFSVISIISYASMVSYTMYLFVH